MTGPATPAHRATASAPAPAPGRPTTPVRPPGTEPDPAPETAPAPGRPTASEPHPAPGKTPEQAAPGRAPAGRDAPPGPATAVTAAERLARAALTRIAEPGDEVLGRLLDDIGAEEAVRRLSRGGALPGVGERRRAGYRVRLDGLDPERDLTAMEGMGGRLVCPGDGDWPCQLDDLGDQRPIALWVRGAPSLRLLALRSIAVVGARACTPYGTHVAGTLACDLAESGWTVVSGAAYGVDGAAHRGALAAGGATVAVVASGVDVPYPRGHAELLERIAEQGLVLGELPPGAHPTRSRFVLRNRVIAALSPGTVVIEARYRSGALVTARRAAELGRFTMAVPGPVTSVLSGGTHELLRSGAQLVTRAAEVVELCGDIGELAPEHRGPLLARDLLPALAARVLEAVPTGEGAPLAHIARDAGVGRDDTRKALFELLPLGYVERDGARWRLVPGVANACAGDPPRAWQHPIR
jgi:DNA processing protein